MEDGSMYVDEYGPVVYHDLYGPITDHDLIIGLIAGLIVWGTVFGLCGILAARYRHRDQVWGFLIGAVLGIIGVLLILVFPEGRQRRARSRNLRSELPDNPWQELR